MIFPKENANFTLNSVRLIDYACVKTNEPHSNVPRLKFLHRLHKVLTCRKGTIPRCLGENFSQDQPTLNIKVPYKFEYKIQF